MNTILIFKQKPPFTKGRFLQVLIIRTVEDAGPYKAQKNKKLPLFCIRFLIAKIEYI